MYLFLQKLLCDKKGGEIFTLFSTWHFFYIVLAAAAAAAGLLLCKRKGLQAGQRFSRFLIGLAFGMYIADFFLMPLAYGEIDIEKLPFHACTAMCVMCFLSCRVEFLKKYRISFVKLGFISNLVYLIYPAGVMWHAVHPLSYRVIQTLLFHGVMAVCGFLTLVTDCSETELRKYRRDLAVVAAMTAWAMLGNCCYNGTSGEYSHFFNWFFVVRDPFNFFPEASAPFIMPVLNTAVFFAVEMLASAGLLRIRRRSASRRMPDVPK